MKPIFKFISIFFILLNFNLFADCTKFSNVGLKVEILKVDYPELYEKYNLSGKDFIFIKDNEWFKATYHSSSQGFDSINTHLCGDDDRSFDEDSFYISGPTMYYIVSFLGNLDSGGKPNPRYKAYSYEFYKIESISNPCQKNEIYNPETKKCEPECEGDMVKNPKTGKCECPEYKDDEYGFYKSVFDKNEKRCKVCAPGTYANKKSGTCDTDCSGLSSTIDLMDCMCQLKSKGGFKHAGINPKELASIFEPSFYPYFGDVCYFACEKPGSAIEVREKAVRGKATPNSYKRICVDLKNSKKDIPINPYPGNDDEDPSEEKINPDDYTVVDVSDIPENVINDLLNKVKDEIDKNPGKTTTEKQDNITVTKGNDIDIEKIKNKKGDGLTQKITYPKPGVTVIEHEDGSVDLIFDGKKMKKSDKPGKTPPGGGTGKTDDNKSSGDGGNSDNSGGSTNITNNLNIKDYSKDLKSIVDILKDIERNTAKTANNSLNGNLDTGDTSKIPSGEGELDGITDSLGNYDFEGEISKAMGYFDNVEKSAKDLLSLIKGDGIPSIKKTNSPTSCPITRSFISPTINEEITWDICKVLYPHKEAYYILFYLSFMVTFIIACYKLLIFLFVSFR
ncbi:hypothetical protein O6B97_01195 [Campylobacter ureolyticus]|uniref:hypothetical protein n=1 Tax=Campylobacter ureolyticus TaxID=827 RepID=UPI0022B36F44|nr:hypothetical protein [Campylobacter ureolyticus]MCZ6185713.1 hypothetical protein [Campylobacter ureolyticus]